MPFNSKIILVQKEGRKEKKYPKKPKSLHAIPIVGI
jgi:hypothetical protein